jgi:hypothetical protein
VSYWGANDEMATYNQETVAWLHPGVLKRVCNFWAIFAHPMQFMAVKPVNNFDTK